MSDDSVSVLKEIGWQQNIWTSKGEFKKTVAFVHGCKTCKHLREAWNQFGASWVKAEQVVKW